MIHITTQFPKTATRISTENAVATINWTGLKWHFVINLTSKFDLKYEVPNYQKILTLQAHEVGI